MEEMAEKEWAKIWNYAAALGELMREDRDEVEFSCRKHARKVAEAWGELPAYRRKRLEIRHKEKARRERLKNRV